MSGYARAAHALGAVVSGSDRAQTPYSERLRDEGVLTARIGHEAHNLPAGEDVELIYSSAIPTENPERIAARERGLPDRPRAELLAELTGLRRTIAVAGAHGKTTTASMIVHALRAAGVDPSWLVGSAVGSGLANSHWAPTRHGDWLVVEADESDRSMLSLHVEIAVLTNVELDHHATFASLAQLRDAFREFLALARRAIVVWERPELTALLPAPGDSARAGAPGDSACAGALGGSARAGAPGDSARAGALGGSAPAGEVVPANHRTSVEIVSYDVPAPRLRPGGSTLDWRGVEVSLSVPGAHNALNAAATLEVARLVGVDAAASMVSFRGAARRFERLGQTASGAEVIDDYAHHPTEIAATLTAARTLEPKRLVAVFQPHLYSRTAMLSREFGVALAQADVVVLLDVYPARERAEDHPGVSGLTIARAAAEHAAGRQVLWLPTFDVAERVLGGLLGAGDLCLVMGAGDVDTLGRRLVERDGRRLVGTDVVGTDGL
jgi:UDP-N-acetylmuramate--alanine ligase